MKKSLLLALFCTTTMFCKAQLDKKEAVTEEDKQNKVTYIIGTTKVAGYSVETRTYNASSLDIENKTAPILQVYLATKDKFVGEYLTNEKGKKTKIVDMKLEPTPTGKDNIFTVIGKDFSMSFKLTNGFILLDEKNTVVFYTDGVGVWKVNRKI